MICFVINSAKNVIVVVYTTDLNKVHVEIGVANLEEERKGQSSYFHYILKSRQLPIAEIT